MRKTNFYNFQAANSLLSRTFFRRFVWKKAARTTFLNLNPCRSSNAKDRNRLFLTFSWNSFPTTLEENSELRGACPRTKIRAYFKSHGGYCLFSFKYYPQKAVTWRIFSSRASRASKIISWIIRQICDWVSLPKHIVILMWTVQL